MKRQFHTKRLLLLPALLVALVFALAACGGDEETTGGGAGETAAGATTGEGTQPSSEPAEISVALDWFANPDHLALYYALDKGIWDDKNLTVTMKTPSDPTAGLKLVATNRFDVAVFYEGDMFFAAEQNLPVVAVGSLIPTPLNSVMATADSPVQSPEDFKGATIGVAGLPFDDAILDTIRRQQNLSEDDVQKVNVGFNLVPALLTGKADAVIGAYWNIEATHVESETGEPPTVIQLEELGVPHYDELLIVANKERLESEPEYAEAVRRFLAGVVEGTEAAAGDEAGTIEILKEETEYTDEEIEAMVPTTIGVLEPPSGLPIGCFDLDGWQTFGDWMLENELLEGPVDPATIATNEYLPQDCS